MMNVAAKVANKLASALDFFKLYSMSAGFDFRVSGSKGSSGMFDVELKGTVGGSDFTYGFEIDLLDLAGSAIRLFKNFIKDKIASWFSRERLLGRGDQDPFDCSTSPKPVPFWPRVNTTAPRLLRFSASTKCPPNKSPWTFGCYPKESTGFSLIRTSTRVIYLI